MADSIAKSPSSSTSRNPHAKALAWKACLQQTPWSAMILALIIIACMGASACIIIVSEKQTVASWKVQPTVLLAVLSSVLNFALAAAMSISIAISWWKSASSGTTLVNLHYIWEHGTGLNPIPALFADFDVKKVILVAWIVAVVKFINNPLLQRATHIKVQDVVENETMMIDITQRLPDGWPGKIQNASAALIIGGPHGLSAAQGWWWNSTTTSHNEPGYYCNGTCTGKVLGAGISHDCNSTAETLDLLASGSDDAVIFAINTTLSENSTGAPSLLMTTLYSSAINDSCIATISIDTCKIEAAVVEYPITIQGTTVSLNYDKLQDMAVISTYISAGDLSTAPKNAGAGPLEGLNDFLGYYLYANVTEELHFGWSKPLYEGPSTIADMFYDSDPSSYDNYTSAKCNLKWSRPTEYVLNSMHEFMFRSALSAGNGTEPQIFIAQRTNPALVFQSEYRYLAAALAVILLALLAILFLLWGWWELGRPVSLSPLETAKAFGAPMMQPAGRNPAVEEILKDNWGVRVRYEREMMDDGERHETAETAISIVGSI